jgi:crotonobetaine/carnitine-CoA ligase
VIETVGEILRVAARRDPDGVAVLFEDQRVRYADLDAQADALAAGLRARRVRPGDRVAVLLGNRPEFLVANFGVARAGAVFVPLVTQSTVAELEYFVQQSGCVYLLTDAERWARVGPEIGVNPAFAGLLGVGVLDGAEPWPVVAGGPGVVADVVVSPDDVASFMYTSGSTGRPKAVVHSHRTVVLQAEAVADRLGYTPADRLMTVFPLFHGNALVWSAITALYAGASIVLTRRFSARQFWDDARRYQVTAVNLLLGATNMLLAQPPHPLDREHGLRLVLSTVTDEVYAAFTDRFGVDVVTLWAFAESPLGTMVSPGFGYRPGLIGWPMGHHTEVQVTGPEGAPVPDGATGELWVRSPANMLRYHDNPAETARVLRPDGWIRSGDLGLRGADGMFTFAGREKHVIRRSGENISGEEVENRLAAHPDVAEAAVIAVPDPIRGEEVKAFVVPRAGVVPTEADLHAWVAQALADFKVPRYIMRLDQLPKTGPEKIDLPRLRREYTDTGCWDARSELA